MTTCNEARPWADRPLFIIGGGTSLRGFDFSRIRSKGRLLGCNRSAFSAEADALVTLDAHWVRMDRVLIEEFCARGGEAYLGLPADKRHLYKIRGATIMNRERRGDVLSTNPIELTGTNTGFTALNLAFHKRPRVVYLLGYDMKTASGNTHFHGGYSWTSAHVCRFMGKWALNFGRAKEQLEAAGVKVYNCIGNPESLIPCFDKIPLESLYDLEDA